MFIILNMEKRNKEENKLFIFSSDMTPVNILENSIFLVYLYIVIYKVEIIDMYISINIYLLIYFSINTDKCVPYRHIRYSIIHLNVSQISNLH